MKKQLEPTFGKTYKHPELGPCTVMFMAKHSETDEPMVIYSSNLYGENYATRLSAWLKTTKKVKSEYEKEPESIVVQYPEPGLEYRHYKGGKYLVHMMATNTETDEAMVVYQSLYFGSNHVRPLSMWFESVTVPKEKRRLSYTTTRFQLIKP
jgi:hypothetical protein